MDFSFSGLKTAVRTHVDKLPEGPLSKKDVQDLAYAFQTAVAEILAERSAKALDKFLEDYKTNAPSLVVCGGVAANQTIRAALEKLAQDKGFTLFAPPMDLCSDNAAMIAWAGIERLKKGEQDSFDFKARPRWPLDPTAAPRHGAGVKA